MAGEENLIPMSERSKDEVRKIARKGGIASGETRRKKKTMREQAEMFLNMPVTEDKVKKKLSEMGIEGEEHTRALSMVVAMYNNAMKGNVRAFKSLLELVGERMIGVEMSGEVNNPLAGLSTEELKKLVDDD